MQEASINLFSDKQITLPSSWIEELSFETTVGDANVFLLGFTDIIGYEADSLDVLSRQQQTIKGIKHAGNERSAGAVSR